MTPLETPCREWQLGCNQRGYGQVRRQYTKWYVHRLVWTLANGPIPDGMYVCHRCDNPPCFRLDHLFLGTALDNNRDKALKGRARGGDGAHLTARTHCPKGHPYSGENLKVYRNKTGWHRGCKECGRAASRNSWRRRAASIRMAAELGIDTKGMKA